MGNVKTNEEKAQLKSQMTQLGLSSNLIDAKLANLDNKQQVIVILTEIAQEFDFFFLHGFDLYNGSTFDWAGYETKLRMLNKSNLNNEYLVYIVEVFMQHMREKQAKHNLQNDSRI